MAKTAKYQMKKEFGCGFTSSCFAFKGFRKTVRFQPNQDSHKKNNPTKPAKPKPVQPEKQKIVKPVSVIKPKRSDPTSSSSTSGSSKPAKPVNLSCTKKKEPLSSSSDLSLTLTDQERQPNANGTLFRSSSRNVMLLGHSGNLKQQQGKGTKNDVKKNVSVEKSCEFGNIFHNAANKSSSDAIKLLGNEKYKQGKYDEALKLYNQAITIDPTKASYYSNKSAALMGLGRFLEAVVQCREAIQIDSSYHNAQYRLANLYLRLGLPEKAVYQYKCSEYRKTSTEDIAQAEYLETCIKICTYAQYRQDWNKLIFESQNVLSLGADSAPMIYAMRAEALLNLRKHEEAYAVVEKWLMCTSTELYVEIFGSSSTAELLAIRAQVYMSNGRFEDAVTDVQQALTICSSNEVIKVADRVKCVTSARSKGNGLFKGSRITEALVAYNEGLECDRNNSVLLCDRAACRSELGQYEKAAEDCTAALLVRPNYRKARLCRANCNAEMKKWEAAIPDYELLMQETGKDEEEVRNALSRAKLHWNKLQNGLMDTEVPPSKRCIISISLYNSDTPNVTPNGIENLPVIFNVSL